MMLHLIDTISHSLKLPARVQALIQAIQNQTDLNPQKACQCVAEANLQAEDLMLWADFDHPLADSYGRHLIYDGGNFEIMVMSWAPGDFSAIHDHGEAQWGAVQSFGHAEHSVYQLQHNRLSIEDIMPFSTGSVIAVDHDLIHQMGNPSQHPFLSLHVYGSATHQGAITGSARIFDLLADKIQFTDGGVFFCLPDELVTHEIVGLQGDDSATLRHHLQMLARLQRMPIPLSTPLQKIATQLRAEINCLQRSTHFSQSLFT